MKAIILKERPIGAYYELPIFESNPRYCINWPDITIGGLPKKVNNSKKYEYSLIFEPNGNGIWDQLWTYGSIDLNDNEIHLINKSYFYMLDHPELQKITIPL